MRETLIDFHAGYLSSVFFAFVFLILGKMVLFGSSIELSSSGTIFARQLIELYSNTIGEWARPLIIIVAFSAMFSTSLTTIDAYPRSLATSSSLLFTRLRDHFGLLHRIWLIVGFIAGFLIISFFVDRLGDMLAFAMIISFLTAPVFALLNYRVMHGSNVQAVYKPRQWERILSVAGIVFMAGFGLVFLYWYFILS